MKDFVAGICVGAAATVLVLFGCAMLSEDSEASSPPEEEADLEATSLSAEPAAE